MEAHNCRANAPRGPFGGAGRVGKTTGRSGHRASAAGRLRTDLAVDWLLRHARQGLAERKLDWRQREALDEIDKDLAGQLAKDRNWFVTKHGYTFAVIHGPIEFIMGAPLYEPGREKTDELPHPI